MVDNSEDQELRDKAEKIVEAKIGFRQHLLFYLIVNFFLFIVWLVIALVVGGGAWFPWFVFPLAGWGIGIILHAYETYGATHQYARREELIRKEMERMRDHSGREPRE
jgi:fatty acid desaturase